MLGATRGYCRVRQLREQRGGREERSSIGIVAGGGRATRRPGRRRGRSRRRPAVRDASIASSVALTALVNNAGILELQMRVERDGRRAAYTACSRPTSPARSSARARRSGGCRRGMADAGGAHRQRVVSGRAPGLARRVRRLRGVEGRDRHVHRWARARGRRPRAFASMRCARASSTPTSTQAAECPTASNA